MSLENEEEKGQNIQPWAPRPQASQEIGPRISKSWVANLGKRNEQNWSSSLVVCCETCSWDGFIESTTNKIEVSETHAVVLVEWLTQPMKTSETLGRKRQIQEQSWYTRGWGRWKYGRAWAGEGIDRVFVTQLVSECKRGICTTVVASSCSYAQGGR